MSTISSLAERLREDVSTVATYLCQGHILPLETDGQQLYRLSVVQEYQRNASMSASRPQPANVRERYGPDYAALGKLFRHRREEHRIDQAELARRLSIGLDYLRKIEAGVRSRPGLESIARIAAALDIPPEEIFHVARLPTASPAIKTWITEYWDELTVKDRAILVGLANVLIRQHRE